MKRLFCLLFSVSLIATGCIHLYHDYRFEPTSYSLPGMRLRVGARLHDRYGAFDGKPVDTAGLSWYVHCSVGLDDTLRGSAYVIVDSLHLTVPGRVDTVECNVPRRLYYPRNTSTFWPCDPIRFSELHADSVNLSMLVWLVFGEDGPRRRYEVLWTGQLKKTRVHSDY